MTKKEVKKNLELRSKNNGFVRLTRKSGKFRGITRGLILKISDDFILLQETDDFRILGYMIIPIKTIIDVRFNNDDRTYETILKKEGLLKKLKPKYKIDLTSWMTICDDIKKTGLTIISECENPKQDYFCIGKLQKINKATISIRYFNAEGILDKEDTKHKYSEITKLSFDDHYANVFSKYIKE